MSENVKQAPTEYVVLVGYSDAESKDTSPVAFTTHSCHSGTGDNAKRAAIKSDKALAGRVEKGEAWLVAVPARSWQPKRAVVKPRDPVLEV